MTKRSTPLIAAAEAMEHELRIFDELATKADAAPIDSQKRLHRVGQLLVEVCDAETRLQARLVELVGHLSAARRRHEALAARVNARAEQVGARAEVFRALLARLEGLAEEVAPIGVAARADVVDLEEVQARIRSAVESAAALEADAFAADFGDLALQARARKEQLAASVARIERLREAGLPES